MRRLLTGYLALALLAGACGDDGGGEDRAAVTSIPDDTTTTSSTTTEPPIPPIDVIPQDVSLITEEYVEQVLDALYEVDLEAVEAARAEGVVDASSIALLEATTSAEASLQRVNDLIQLSITGFEGIRTRPGPLTFDVVKILARTSECIFAEVRVDSTRMFPAAEIPAGTREFVRLFRASEEQRSTGLNPTAWVVDQLPVTLDGSDPSQSCPA